MKRIFSIISTAIVLLGLTTACSKEPAAKTLDGALVGEWHKIEVLYDGEETEIPVDVYLVLNKDCTFVLYQKFLGTNDKDQDAQDRYTRFTGTCKFENNVLSGTYASGKDWNESYYAEVVGDQLQLTTSDYLEVQTYRKEALSATEKANAAISTKAAKEIAPVL